MATVSASGEILLLGMALVNAKSIGTTTITAETINGKTAKCEITVYTDKEKSNIFADVKYNSWQYNAAKPAVTYHQQFSDVKSEDWFAKAVTWASDNGIVSSCGQLTEVSFPEREVRRKRMSLTMKILILRKKMS